MERNSNRWQQWMKASELRKVELDKALALQARWESFITKATPLPKYRMWIVDGWALLDGEMIGFADLDFIETQDGSFKIRVESPEEAIGLARRITGCVALGLEELEDGEYYEWYDENGDDLTKQEVR
jgi:hypothetical protein